MPKVTVICYTRSQPWGYGHHPRGSRMQQRIRVSITRPLISTLHDEQRDIPNLEFSPSHVSIEFSQIAFPTTVWPKDDRTDSAQEERLGLPYCTMILTICVVVDESKCLDTPNLEFSIIFEHLPFSLGFKPILRLLLVHRNQAIWR